MDLIAIRKKLSLVLMSMFLVSLVVRFNWVLSVMMILGLVELLCTFIFGRSNRGAGS